MIELILILKESDILYFKSNQQHLWTSEYRWMSYLYHTTVMWACCYELKFTIIIAGNCKSDVMVLQFYSIRCIAVIRKRKPSEFNSIR